MAAIDFSNAFSWATSISRTRLTSVAGFSLHNTFDAEAVSDLPGILNVIRQLQIPHVPNRELRALESIGEGVTFSVVKHIWQGRIVALKYIKQPNTHEPQPKDAFRKRLRSVLQEIMVMQHKPLAAHPNIVELLGYGWQQAQDRPVPFTVVELGSLGSLRLFLQSQSNWSIRKKLITAGDVAAGLMALHRAGVVHGDLKLDNVICFRDRYRPNVCQAKLCDFSHSIAVSGASRNVHYYGTPLYLPPEALAQRDRPISSVDVYKCDIWAFGLAVWEIMMMGDVYFRPSWRKDPQFSRTSSTNQSLDSSWSLLPTPTPPKVDSQPDWSNESSQWSIVFGDFDISHLSKFACMVVDDLTDGTASSLGFARSYLRPLMKRTLDPDPKKRLSDISRLPIITNWQNNSRYSALESKLAFHTHTSNLAFDMFRPDRQADIAWSMQVHIHNDLESVLTGDQQSPNLSRTSFQYMLCKIVGFGCDIDLPKAAIYLEAGLQHSSALSDFVGQALQSGLGGHMAGQIRPFADRAAAMFASRWDVDLRSAVNLCDRPDDELPPYEQEEQVKVPIQLGIFSNLQRLLAQASKCTATDDTAVISQSLVQCENGRMSLSWLDLTIFSDDHAFFDTYQDLLVANDLNRIDSWTMSPLLFACVRGNTPMVRRLLLLGADPLSKIPSGCNLLHFLFCLGDQAADILHMAVGICAELVNEINVPCEKAFAMDTQWSTEIEGSPLAIATTIGHLELARALLSYQAASWLPAFSSARQDCDYIWTPMHLAVKYNFYDLVTLFMNQPDSLSFSVNHKGDFPLASALSFCTMVERIGIHGPLSTEALEKTIGLIQPDTLCSSNKKGATPILQAIDFENYEVVRGLLAARPDLATGKISNPESSSDYTFPLHFACQICARKDVEYALRIPKLILKVCEAALNMTDGHGRSAIHFAALSDSQLIARWLLHKGLDVNSYDNLGRTPLMISQSKRTSIALIEGGARVELKDNEGRNAAHYAATHGSHEILKVLLEHGIEGNSSSHSSRTLLHDAVSAGSLECVKLLCQAGASVNAVTQDGSTPLHFALATTPEIVLELMKRGSDPTIKDIYGRTAAQIAVTQMTDPVEGLGEAQAIFKSLVQPLHEDIAAGERNQVTLAQILHTCAAFGSGTSIKLFFGCLGPRTPITATTLWQGRSPLHTAALTANAGAASGLVGKVGVNVNALDSSGQTPLTYLSMVSPAGPKVEEFCKLISAGGGNLYKKNAQSEAAWTIALQHGNFRLLAYLMFKLSDNKIVEMLETHPLSQKHLLAAVDVDYIVFVAAFARRVGVMPTTYEPKLMESLAKACMCVCEWAPIGRRLNFICIHRPSAVREAIMGGDVWARLGGVKAQVEKRGEFHYSAGEFWDLHNLFHAIVAKSLSPEEETAKRASMYNLEDWALESVKVSR